MMIRAKPSVEHIHHHSRPSTPVWASISPGCCGIERHRRHGAPGTPVTRACSQGRSTPENDNNDDKPTESSHPIPAERWSNASQHQPNGHVHVRDPSAPGYGSSDQLLTNVPRAPIQDWRTFRARLVALERSGSYRQLQIASSSPTTSSPSVHQSTNTPVLQPPPSRNPSHPPGRKANSTSRTISHQQKKPNPGTPLNPTSPILWPLVQPPVTNTVQHISPRTPNPIGHTLPTEANQPSNQANQANYHSTSSTSSPLPSPQGQPYPCSSSPSACSCCYGTDCHNCDSNSTQERDATATASANGTLHGNGACSTLRPASRPALPRHLPRQARTAAGPRLGSRSVEGDSTWCSQCWAHPLAQPELGCVLLANRDDMQFFHRAAILITSHDDRRGSVGFVINKSSPLLVGELQVTSGSPGFLDAFGAQSLALGGPVHLDRVTLLHHYLGLPGAHKVAEGLYCGGAAGAVKLVQAGLAHPSDFKLVLGMAGWGPGQLQQEVSQGYWKVVAASPHLLLPPSLPQLAGASAGTRMGDSSGGGCSCSAAGVQGVCRGVPGVSRADVWSLLMDMSGQ